jgi:hypothetical protein
MKPRSGLRWSSSLASRPNNLRGPFRVTPGNAYREQSRSAVSQDRTTPRRPRAAPLMSHPLNAEQVACRAIERAQAETSPARYQQRLMNPQPPPEGQRRAASRLGVGCLEVARGYTRVHRPACAIARYGSARPPRKLEFPVRHLIAHPAVIACEKFETPRKTIKPRALGGRHCAVRCQWSMQRE